MSLRNTNPLSSIKHPNYETSYGKHHEPPELRNFVTLFNVIQASHHLEIPSLMDLSCRALINKVKGGQYQNIIKLMHDFEPHQNFGDSDFSSVWRKREKEFLINVAAFRDDVQRSSFVASCLLLVERRVNSVDQHVSKMMNLELDMANKELQQIVHNLYLWISGDSAFADRLNSAALGRLLDIVKSDISHSQLKRCALAILGRATFKIFDKVKQEIPVLVKLLTTRDYHLRNAALVTLSRLADAFSVYKEAIIDNCALEEVLKIVDEWPDPAVLLYASKFLVVVCRGGNLSPSKVEVARSITESIFQNELDDYVHKSPIVYTCYSLQYLSYDEPLALGHILSRKLLRFVGNNCTAISGSALGVIGNIARMGMDGDIEFMISHCKLLECLGLLMVTCKWKKFQMEACQIMSNIVARNKRWREEMATDNIIMTLCSLLEKGDSDVKMEVAWVIFNTVYGNCKNIDQYL